VPEEEQDYQKELAVVLQIEIPKLTQSYQAGVVVPVGTPVKVRRRTKN
jgi:hypothetical protein